MSASEERAGNSTIPQNAPPAAGKTANANNATPGAKPSSRSATPHSPEKGGGGGGRKWVITPPQAKGKFQESRTLIQEFNDQLCKAVNDHGIDACLDCDGPLHVEANEETGWIVKFGCRNTDCICTAASPIPTINMVLSLLGTLIIQTTPILNSLIRTDIAIRESLDRDASRIMAEDPKAHPQRPTKKSTTDHHRDIMIVMGVAMNRMWCDRENLKTHIEISRDVMEQTTTRVDHLEYDLRTARETIQKHRQDKGEGAGEMNHLNFDNENEVDMEAPANKRKASRAGLKAVAAPKPPTQRDSAPSGWEDHIPRRQRERAPGQGGGTGNTYAEKVGKSPTNDVFQHVQRQGTQLLPNAPKKGVKEVKARMFHLANQLLLSAPNEKKEIARQVVIKAGLKNVREISITGTKVILYMDEASTDDNVKLLKQHRIRAVSYSPTQGISERTTDKIKQAIAKRIGYLLAKHDHLPTRGAIWGDICQDEMENRDLIDSIESHEEEFRKTWKRPPSPSVKEGYRC